MRTFEEFRDRILALVRIIGSTFDEPDDDWIPMLFMLDYVDQIVNISLLGFLDTPAEKDHFVAVALPTLLRMHRAQTAGLLISTWMVGVRFGTGEGDKEAAKQEALRLGRAGLSNHPDRKEFLMVQFATADRAEEFQAPILRRPDGPPDLGPWGPSPVDEGMGRLFRIVQRSLRSIATPVQ